MPRARSEISVLRKLTVNPGAVACLKVELQDCQTRLRASFRTPILAGRFLKVTEMCKRIAYLVRAF